LEQIVDKESEQISEKDQDRINSKVRTVRRKVEENSETLDRIVNSIISKYNRDLDDFIVKTKTMIDRKDDLTDSEVEKLVLKLPIFMYFASGGLESLGIEGDTAKAVKLEVFNNAYIDVHGTIQDKTKYAELKTFSEQLVEVAYSRAYKKLKTQMEMAESIFSGAKKVMSKRMLEMELGIRDTGTGSKVAPSRRRDRDRDN
jgi:hypothetical protein